MIRNREDAAGTHVVYLRNWIRLWPVRVIRASTRKKKCGQTRRRKFADGRIGALEAIASGHREESCGDV